MANAAPALVRIGVVGHGTVGAAFTALVARQAEHIEARTGVRLVVTNVAVRNVERHRSSVGAARLTADPLAVVNAADVDLVVEVMGGTTVARDVVAAALKAGKPVVTANKALLAAHSAELFALADEAHTDLLFEAAVCGGIPLIRPLRESLRGEPIRRVLGIVNGTTNYILTKMTQEGSDYASALAGAQTLGYAEADPTADVEGLDAAAKIAIVAMFAFGVRVVSGDVFAEGISQVTASDIAMARKFGYVIKLLGIAESVDGAVSVRVHPASGSLMFYGRGAGGDPTASSVLGDVIDAAVNKVRGTHAALGSFQAGRFTAMSDVSNEYMLTLEVIDRPGVLHAVTGVFARHGVSIRAAEQDGIGTDARLVFLTHTARERDVQACMTELRGLDVVSRVGSSLRVVSE
jgi:homoserine dehydrogenase